MSKIFVVAGSYHQAKEWIKQDIEKRINAGQTSLTLSHYVYVSSAADLRGYSDPHGMFIGTWKERPDIRDIVEVLMMQSTSVNRSLAKIHRDLSKTVRQPQLHKVSGGWAVAVDDAALMLAQAIDDEVLATLCKKINGGELSGNTTSNNR
jgi:predicted nucleic acid-binding protein